MYKILNIYYKIPISILTPVKLKIKECQLKKRLKRKNHSIQTLQSNVKRKALHLLLVCVNANFKNQSLIDIQLMQEFS